MTTDASGRCTSAPVDVAIAIGMKPTLATSAVISTGRSRRSAPPRTASRVDRPSARSPLIELTSTTPLSMATPNSAMNPTDADRFKVHYAQPQRRDAADERERDVADDEHRLAHGVEGDVEEDKDDRHDDRHDQHQALGRALLILEL